MHWIRIVIFLHFLGIAAIAQITQMDYSTSPAMGLGPTSGVMRRDPSDIIQVGDLYYIWYTKGAANSGYDATIWYATSPDGHAWTEKGEALTRGPKGSWEEQSVFTPNILAAKEKYWLFYTAVPKPFVNSGPKITKTAIGLAVSDSPNGPWSKLETNPILRASDDPKDFDSLRIDDACLIICGGKYWMYYKGRQWNNTPENTMMGVAVADQPEGPYVKHDCNPLVRGGHEVLVWPYAEGVVALIGTVGPKGIAKTLQYAPDGVTFNKMAELRSVPSAPGAFRAVAFKDSDKRTMIQWGVHIGTKAGSLPFLERFEYTWRIDSAEQDGGGQPATRPESK
jgi:beta-xylosidase